MENNRRQFLTLVGAGSLAAITGTPPSEAAPLPLKRKKGAPPAFFTPIEPSKADNLVLPQGYQAQIIAHWGDPLGSKDPEGNPEHFGFNNDFTAYFPIDALTGGKSCTEGLLWVNHEYPNPLFVSDYPHPPKDLESPELKTWIALKKTKEQIILEKKSVGGSVLHIKLVDGKWLLVANSKFTRRFTALYPQIELSGPSKTLVPHGVGTLANCSGGRTPWMTVMTCEENYPEYNTLETCRWSDVPGMEIDELQYGWVVEIDPFGDLPPKKHSALGRFKHENTTWAVGSTKKFVVYMGDDEADQCLYKFVSKNPLIDLKDRAACSKLLEEGTLYAADMGKGRWIPLVYDAPTAAKIHSSKIYLAMQKADPKFQITSQGELLIHARVAAKILGATPLDRCEDCEVHPKDGSLYVALTNNTKHGNFYGHIVRLVEQDDNPEATSFEYEVFLAGGPQSGLACPDNLAFDADGNLWCVCDISSSKIGSGVYKSFGNNGLYVIPTSGDSAGDAFQFASGPNDAELTGPWFSEDGKTLFLSVQHPGEESPDKQNLTSNWPGKPGDIPKPAVVAITGFPKE
ncbi:MAG: DUF839 domain-containing protein [Zavarzinella sp.]